LRGDRPCPAAAAGGGRTTAATLVARQPPTAWHRIDRPTGPTPADFVAVRVRPPRGPGDRWLIGERSLDGRTCKYYVSNLPATAPLTALVTLVRSRWPIEQQYRELKDELGFDHFEGRSFRGWAHHVVLAAVAFTFLQLERGRHPRATPRPTLPVVRAWVREIVAVLYIIHTRRVLNLIDAFRRNPPPLRR
jgi:SRSO17 transposase